MLTASKSGARQEAQAGPSGGHAYARNVVSALHTMKSMKAAAAHPRQLARSATRAPATARGAPGPQQPKRRGGASLSQHAGDGAQGVEREPGAAGAAGEDAGARGAGAGDGDDNGSHRPVDTQSAHKEKAAKLRSLYQGAKQLR